MRTYQQLAGWRETRREITGSVGFVPTMGALHQGHAALIRRSVEENEFTVLSIYVNPTQFNNPNDLAHYPRTRATDLELARALGVDAVIAPAYGDLYPDGYRYRVEETAFSRELCGAHRPGHFTGVLTVVMKLLQLVRPDRAYFGEKDYQQYQLVRDMVDSFFMDVSIVPCRTVREEDGLALSSRNALLDEGGRRTAPRFSSLLRAELPDADVCRLLAGAGFGVDYVETRGDRRYGAVTVTGPEREVRLIDNVPMSSAGAIP